MSQSVFDSEDKDINKTPLLQDAQGWWQEIGESDNYNAAWWWSDRDLYTIAYNHIMVGEKCLEGIVGKKWNSSNQLNFIRNWLDDGMKKKGCQTDYSYLYLWVDYSLR